MKKWLDIALLLIFFCELSSMFISTYIHEALGYIFMILVIIHNVKNKNFYINLSRNKHTIQRFTNTLSMALFAFSFISLAVSGIAMSFAMYPNVNWRSVHLISAIAALILLFKHLIRHAKRYIHGKKLYLASMAAFVLAVAAIFGLPYLDRWYHKVLVNSELIVIGEKVHIDNVVTIYFSRVGNTDFPPNIDAVSGASIMNDGNQIIGNAEMIAYMVNNAVDGDIFEIQTIKTYPATYSDTTKVGKQEIVDNELPELKAPLPDLSNYNTIIIVYPLWWNTLPQAVVSFLSNYDLTGKTIIPIVTHGGSGIGDSLIAIKKATQAKVIDDYLDIYSSDISVSRQNIADYLKHIKELLH